MKRTVAVLLAVIMMFGLTVTSFAADSPGAKTYVKVKLRAGDPISGVTANDRFEVVQKGNVIEVKPSQEFINNYGDFKGWKIYKVVSSQTNASVRASGRLSVTLSSLIPLATTYTYPLATEGTDYTFVSGNLNSANIKLTANADLVLCAQYARYSPDPAGGLDPDGKSPKTGDMTVVYFAVAMLAVLTVTVGVKRKISSK